MLKFFKYNMFFGPSLYVNLILDEFSKPKNYQYDIKEMQEKTSKIIDKNKDYYFSMLTYNSGNCWFNHKITRGEIINEREQSYFDNIVKIKQLVEPLSYPINLFHGFEYGVKYPKFIKNKVIDFNFILSKTPSWSVANWFAERNDSLFLRKYLFVTYPKNTKHLNIDVLREGKTEEWEYLSVNEKLRYKDNVYHLSLFPWPQIHIYYCFDYVSYNL